MKKEPLRIPMRDHTEIKSIYSINIFLGNKGGRKSNKDVKGTQGNRIKMS